MFLWLKSRPYWFIGGIVGIFIWLLSLASFSILEIFETTLRPGIMLGILQGVLGIMAFPIGMVGWMFIWGDNNPPFPFLSSGLFILISSLSIWFLIGSLFGLAVGKIKSKAK